MELTSFACLLFVAVTFVAYRLGGRWGAPGQNVVLLVASAVFYGMADHRFLLLLLASASVNFALGLRLAGKDHEGQKRIWYIVGLAMNLGLLCYFKYFNFFREGVLELLEHFGTGSDHGVLAIALPLGISFYTFQMLGYLIDVRNEEIEPCKDPLRFFTYVLYFPKIMAGPIERAQRFLPRIENVRAFDAALATDGLRQILWGLLAKVVVADNASEFVDIIFQRPVVATGSTLAVGAFLYFIQIYCDFSGYSNIAIGISKLFGIPLMTNFRTPFFATNISDFWRRWHISLSSWMIDHLFTPLSFLLREKGRWGTVFSISVTFLAVGIWHGANWTFVAFGALQSLYFLPLALRSTISAPPASATSLGVVPSPVHFVRMLGMFILMALSFVLLRAKNIHQALVYYRGLFDASFFSKPLVLPTTVVLMAAVFVSVEWWQRSGAHALENIHVAPRWLRWALYAGILYTVILLNSAGRYQFIYFQF